MEGAGLEVVDIVLSGMADYHEVKSDNISNKTGAIINLGHDTTTVSVVNHGKLVNTEVLQIGGINLEKDIAYVFGVSVFDARTLKEKFASSHKRFCQLNDVYEVKNTLGDFVKLNQLEVSEVVMSRLSEILELARKQILLLTKQEITYLVITGGLTEIKSFKNLVYEIFDKNVIIYTVNTLGVRDNKYVTALGMIKYFIDKMETRGKMYSMISDTDIEELTSPSSKEKKDNTISRIFTNFIGNKEEK
jgi:cell division protein FtsA